MIERPHEAVFREVETPVCGPGDVLVRSCLAGVCRTDIDVLNGELDGRWVRYPCIPGHEWSGIVDAVGEGVGDLDPGDRVVCEGFCYCGACRRCRAGDTHLCEHYDCLGFTRGGGYGELVLVPRRVVHRLPDGVPLDAAVLIEPASVVLKGLLRARPAAGRDGRRHRGRHARCAGDRARPAVLARRGRRVRRSARQELELARRLGADETVDVSARRVRRTRVSSISSSRPPAPSRRSSSRPACRVRAGRIVGLGIAGTGSELRIPADRFVLRDLELIGSVGYTTAVWSRVVELLGAGLVDLAPIVARPCSRRRGSRTPSALMAERRTGSSAGSSSSTTERVTDRRRLPPSRGAGAAGISLAQLLGPAAALGRRRRRRLPRASSLAVRLRQPPDARPAVRRHAVRGPGRRLARQVLDAVDRVTERERGGDREGLPLRDRRQGGRDRGLAGRRPRLRGPARGRPEGRRAGRRVQRRLGLGCRAARLRRREPVHRRASASVSRSRGSCPAATSSCSHRRRPSRGSSAASTA